MCNDAFYNNNYPAAITNEYRLGVITASTQVYSRFAGDVSSAVTVAISQFTTTNIVTQQGNQGQGSQTTPFNNNNNNQGNQGQTTPFNNNQQGNGVTRLPPNNNQGNNFQTTTIRGPFILSTVPTTQMITEARVTPEFNPSEDTFNEAFYDEEESYPAPRQKTNTTPRDIEPLEFAAELLPPEKIIIEETHFNSSKDSGKEIVEIENVTSTNI